MAEATPPADADERGRPAPAGGRAPGMVAIARTLVAAARSCALYPPDHPAVVAAIDRFSSALRSAAEGRILSFGVTPDTLLVDGARAGANGEQGDRDSDPASIAGPIAEAAAWLHARDVLQLTFMPDVSIPVLRNLLAILADDPSSIRANGGPARMWAERGHASVGIEQIDLTRVLQDHDDTHTPRTKDDLWRAIVRAVVDRRKALDEAIQRRLLEIAGDSAAIGDLAQDVVAPHRAADGSPMLTSQAAAVIAAYHHLIGIVDVMAPDRRSEVMHNLATATVSLDPHLVLQLLSAGADKGDDAGMRQRLASAFDDLKVAQLLATTLAIDGQASERLAGVFDTIAPDEPRKRRVLTMTRRLLNDGELGQRPQFDVLWSSMEELLLTYNERPFVSAQYRRGLDEIGARAERMASDALPPELVALRDTLKQENVRRLSVTLLIDLLRLESDRARAPEIAQDVAALAEDLLLAGDYERALAAIRALADQVRNHASATHEGSRVALDALAGSAAFRESVLMLEELGEEEAGLFAQACAEVGPAAADALRDLLDTEEETRGFRRARRIIRGYGARAVTRLAPLVTSPHWYAQCRAAAMLGEIGAADAVPLLQPLLRSRDPRVVRSAVQALANIDDPAAARAVHTVLRAATGEQRRAVVDALVAERDPRVVPVLVRILNESDPVWRDHHIVLETLGAIRQVGDDQAVPHVAHVMRRRSFLAPRKIRAVKQSSLAALKGIGTPAATRAVADAAATGDRLLRKLARAAMQGQVAHG